MRIAFILSALINRGPEVVVSELVSQLQEMGHTCYIYYFDGKEPELYFSCQVERISFYQSIPFSNYDIIHSHGLRPDMYVFLHKPLIRCKTKFVSTIHAYILDDFIYNFGRLKGGFFAYIWLYLLTSRIDKIVTLSNNAIKYYSHWISPEKLTFIYNGRSINISDKINTELQAQIREFKGEFRLLGVNCKLTRRKGVDLLIEALPMLDNYKLLIIGDGLVRKELENQALRLKVDDRCLFLGYQEKAYRFVPFYDIYASPSRSEGFGLAIMEAAIYSRKVLCSDIPIFRELFTETEVCFFDLQNINSLVQAVKQLEKNNSFGLNLNKKWLSSFSPERMASNYFDLYESL